MTSPLQFTLCHVLKGNKPDFHNAMNSELSKPAYENFLTLLRTKYRPDAVKGKQETELCHYTGFF